MRPQVSPTQGAAPSWDSHLPRVSHIWLLLLRCPLGLRGEVRERERRTQTGLLLPAQHPQHPAPQLKSNCQGTAAVAGGKGYPCPEGPFAAFWDGV